MDESLQISRIESYLSGQMSSEQKRLFEADLSSNQEFHRLFLQHKYFLDGMHGMKLNAFSEKLAATPIASTTGSNRKFLLLTLVVMAILALISIVYFSLLPSGKRQLAKQYYAAPLAELQRSEGTARDSIYRTGMQAFDQKDWQLAIAAFDKIDDDHPLHQQVQYYKAHALIGDSQFSDANALFNMLAELPGRYRQQSQWNSILSLLFMNTPQEKLKASLDPVLNDPTHFYHSKALQLQKDLRI